MRNTECRKVTRSRSNHQVVGKGLESFKIADPLLATSSFFLRGSEILATFLCPGSSGTGPVISYSSAFTLPLNSTTASWIFISLSCDRRLGAEFTKVCLEAEKPIISLFFSSVPIPPSESGACGKLSTLTNGGSGSRYMWKQRGNPPYWALIMLQPPCTKPFPCTISLHHNNVKK